MNANMFEDGGKLMSGNAVLFNSLCLTQSILLGMAEREMNPRIAQTERDEAKRVKLVADVIKRVADLEHDATGEIKDDVFERVNEIFKMFLAQHESILAGACEGGEVPDA